MTHNNHINRHKFQKLSKLGTSDKASYTNNSNYLSIIVSSFAKNHSVFANKEMSIMSFAKKRRSRQLNIKEVGSVCIKTNFA